MDMRSARFSFLKSASQHVEVASRLFLDLVTGGDVVWGERGDLTRGRERWR